MLHIRLRSLSKHLPTLGHHPGDWPCRSFATVSVRCYYSAQYFLITIHSFRSLSNHQRNRTPPSFWPTRSRLETKARAVETEPLLFPNASSLSRILHPRYGAFPFRQPTNPSHSDRLSRDAESANRFTQHRWAPSTYGGSVVSGLLACVVGRLEFYLILLISPPARRPSYFDPSRGGTKSIPGDGWRQS